MWEISLLLFAALLLSWFNGANDNFKGVASLHGSGTLSYRTALVFATLATLAGSLCALWIANGLVARFSGKGLVPEDLAGTTTFLAAVGLGAGWTVLLATRLGFPISTTHSLVGGLVGAGWLASGSQVNLSQLGSAFFLPLLVSPLLAAILAAALYSTLSRTRKRLGLEKTACICLGESAISAAPAMAGAQRQSATDLPAQPNAWVMSVSDLSDCELRYTNRVLGVSLQTLLDLLHIISAGAVSFARGLNDTPKIAGLLVAAHAISPTNGLLIVGLGIAAGGLLSAGRVARTLSHRITRMNTGQGLAANLVTSFLVIVASRFGVPVSTTHVSVGALFGMGSVTGNQDTRVVRSILLSWLITLPVAMLSSALAWLLIR